MKRLLPLLLLCLTACHEARLPQDCVEDDVPPRIYPDYADVTVPPNIAPLHFVVEDAGQNATCRFQKTTCGVSDCDVQYVTKGHVASLSAKRWKKLCETPGDIRVDVYTQDEEGRWHHKRPFAIHVSPDTIDPYIAYRLIAPSYVTYEDLIICQRQLSSFRETVVYGNMINSREETGQCINCHAFQQGNPRRMQFHVRQHMGGTLLTYDGQTEKVDLRTDSLISAGVYPAWHPTEPIIAYSTNRTFQTFHTRDVQKVEVQDELSDLILYDITRHKVTQLPHEDDWLDCFPTWSPDGRWLYYCSAHYERTDSALPRQADLIRHYDRVHYSLFRRTFDPSTQSFGPREVVYNAAAEGKSATLPRISPDGRFLMFTLGSFGVFHIWHTDADLRLMDLTSGDIRPLDELNSPQTESYHSWSSSGRWVVFSSRRDDGNFTRPFFAHIDAEGHASKPFELPSDNPLYHRQLLRSYNVPEFISGPVRITPQQLARIIRGNATKAH